MTPPAPARRMKGVLICGGTGSRLRPLTEITNKSLLPVYDQPLLHYPLHTLLQVGIKEIIVISSNEHIDQMATYLGSGSRFDCRFSYRVQDEAGGIAQALGMAEEFVDGDDVCAILGDNVFFESIADAATSFHGGAHVFLKNVPDPHRFGVAELDQKGRVRGIEEKPSNPKTSLAVTGCYFYDARCFEVIRGLKPSPRGELEITDVSNWYARHGELTATVLQDEWIDAGTFESLHQASVLVRDRKLMIAEQAKETAVAEQTAPVVAEPR